MTPVAYRVDYVEKRSRLTTFFRLILLIPHVVVWLLWMLAAGVVTIFAWFAIVITGRWPTGAYRFVADFLRYTARWSGYYYLLFDPYPPFDGGEHPEYPARLEIGPPKASYSRAKAFFRLLLGIPVFIVYYVMNVVSSLLAALAWLVIVILGRQPEGLQSALLFCASYQVRATVYTMLVTEDWPSFGDPPALEAGSGPPAFAAPESPLPR